MNPVPGYRITTAYRRTGHLWSLGFHTGADWAAPRGTPVVAAAGGKVVTRAVSKSFGNYLAIDSVVNGVRYRCYYAHFTSIAVRAGATVKTGQRLGTVGATGNATGPHLHLEARVSPFSFKASLFRNPSVLVNVPKPGSGSGSSGGSGGSKGTTIPKAQRRPWYVTANRLNGRSGPGTNYPVEVVRGRGWKITGTRQTANWIMSGAHRWFAKRYMRKG